MSLCGARVLVTGGAGLIGSHLVDRLIEADVTEVIVLDDLSRGRRDSLAEASQTGKLTFVKGDIRDRGLVAQLLPGVDILYHLAAIRLTLCKDEPRLAMTTMVDGSFDVFELAVAAGVKRVIAASSASVYGSAEVFPTREDHHPYGNDTFYGAAKLFNEAVLASFREMYGLKYIVLRPFNVYGPRMDRDGAYTEVLVRWMQRIDRGFAPIIFGDGKQTMDFVYVDDVARAFVAAGASRIEGEAFNVGTGVETSLDELARAVLSVMGSRLLPEYGPARPVSVPRRLADIQKARKHLGFVAEVSLQDGLSRLVAWWRSTLN